MNTESQKETLKTRITRLVARRSRFSDLHPGPDATRAHQSRGDRGSVISPMIDARAQKKVAERLGIETYGDTTEVEVL